MRVSGRVQDPESVELTLERKIHGQEIDDG